MEAIGNVNMKQEQVLILEPKNELRFKGPFTDVVTSHLKLSNPSDRRVCFKVKTTAPKRYCVRPNNGIVEPHSHATIAVMLQPVDLENLNDKNKHKFMVQTMFAPDGDVNQDNLWREADPSFIMDSKLKCVFELPSNDVSHNPSSTASAASVSFQTESQVNSNMPSASPTVKSPGKISSTNIEDLRKITDENKRLRDELSTLRHENMQLREEGLKQRVRSSAGSSEPVKKPELVKGEFDRMAILMTPQILSVVILMFIAGLFLGKIIF